MYYAGSFAGLGFCSWYLAGKLKAFDRRGHVGKLCVVIAPLLLAAMVAVSRVDDYWHHWQDVFTGGFLGVFHISAVLSDSYVISSKLYYIHIFKKTIFRPCTLLPVPTKCKSNTSLCNKCLRSLLK